MDQRITKPSALAAAIALALMSAKVGAVEVWLCAKPVLKTMPDSTQVTMWGYAQGTNAADSCTSTATVPGPALSVPAGDNTLTVHLNNQLPEATSIVIPGQVVSGQPVRNGNRIVAFTAQAAASTGTQDYSWTNLAPGTYAYMSGSHPAVQVQMGLYGSLKHDAAVGQAYAGVPYATDVTLLYSEVDPALHAAVAGGTYGTAVTSTIDYKPRYFLVNGEAFNGVAPNQTPDITAGNAGDKTLVRMINMGLQTHVPEFQGMYVTELAEDGSLHPYGTREYSVFLPAGKTKDVMLNASAQGRYPVVDRMLGLQNQPGVTGGMTRILAVGATTTPITLAAAADSYATAEDTPLSVAAPGVMGNDTGTGPTVTSTIGTQPLHGAVTLNANGSFTYTPTLNYFGSDIFTYTISDGTTTTAPATVNLSIASVNDAPVANPESYSIPAGQTLTVAAKGVLTNDTDIEGNTLTAVINTAPASGTLALNANGGFTYTNATPGSYTFQYHANDGQSVNANSNIATVTIVVTAVTNTAPVAVDDTFAVTRNVTTNLAVLANDTDAQNNITPYTNTTVTIVTAPNKGGTVTWSRTLGRVVYTPRRNFTGSETFKYTVKDTGNLTSNTATVTVNVR